MGSPGEGVLVFLRFCNPFSCSRLHSRSCVLRVRAVACSVATVRLSGDSSNSEDAAILKDEAILRKLFGSGPNANLACLSAR